MSRRLARAVEQLESRTLFAGGTTFAFAAADHASPESSWSAPSGGHIVEVTIVRGGDVSAAAPATVWLDTPAADGTASAGADYQPVSMQAVTFSAGARAATVSIEVLPDFEAEADETIALRLYADASPPAGAAPLSSSTVTVYDDDNNQPSTVRFAASGFAGAEHPFYGPVTPVGLVRTGSFTEFTTASLAVHAAAPAPGVRPAAEGADFLAGGTTVFFNANDTVQWVNLPVISEGVPEVDEQIGLTLAAGNEMPTPGEGETRLYTLLDVDGGTTLPRVSIADASVVEGDAGSPDGDLSLSLSLSAASDQTVIVAVTTVPQHTVGVPGIADPGPDFMPFNTFATFQPGQTSANVTVPGVIAGDDVAELDETFRVELGNVTFNAAFDDALATVTILDNEPRFSIGDAQVVEGSDFGQPFPQMRFPVTLSRASNQFTGVYVRTVDGSGTATAGNDYFGGPTFVTFAPGETQGEFVVNVVPDQQFEDDETFAVELFGPQGATIGDGLATGTILEDDTPVFFVDDATLREGTNDGQRTANVVVRLLRPVTQPVGVQVLFNPGTADGNDFFAGGEFVTFAPGESSRTIAVPINADFAVEPDETFTVELSSPSPMFRIGDGSATVTIQDDDRGGHFRFDNNAPVTIPEGGSTGTVVVVRDGPTNLPATVRYTLVPGTAGPDDYGRFAGAGAVTGVIEFAAGASTALLGSLPILDDDLDEDAIESFTIVLSEPSDGASVVTGFGSRTVEIFDTDPTLPIISVSDVAVVETAGGSFAEFTVSLDAEPAPAQAVFVNYRTVDGTATSVEDYEYRAGFLTFREGQSTTRTIRVPISDDNMYEPGAAEQFALELTDLVNARYADADHAGTASITDNDPMFGWFEFIPGSTTVAEDGGSVGVGLSFTPTVPAPGVIVDRPQSLSLGWTIFGGVPGSDFTASPDSDYAHRNGRIEFPGTIAGGAFIETTILNDTTAEPDERFAFWLHEPVPEGTAYRGDMAPVTILDDDGGGVFYITGPNTRVEGQTASFDVYRIGSLEAAEVDVVTVDGTATAAGGDFTALVQRLTFAPGETTKAVTVNTTADGTNVELDEQFMVELRNASGNANLSPSLSSITVALQETHPNGLIRLVPEPPAGGVVEGQPFNFRLERIGRADGSVGVNLERVSGTAQQFSDYGDLPFLTLAPGEFSRSFSIPTITDRTDDGDKAVRFGFPPGGIPGALIDAAAATFDMNILDADPAPKLEIGDLTIVEGTGGTVTAMVPVRMYGSLPRGTPSSLQIGYTVVPGTATQLDAFSVSGGVGFFLANYSPDLGVTAYAQVGINPDGLDEGDETFTVVLTPNQVFPPGTPLDIVDGSSTVTILDDDSAPRIAGVFVNGSGWQQSFRDHLAATGLGDATFGYAIDPAAAPDELPWTNLDRLSVRFDKSIQEIGMSALTLRGLNVPTYAATGFAYDHATNTATWSFGTSFAADRLQATLSHVLDMAGNPMTTANGTFRFDVLPGDVNRSGGSVLGSDVTLVRNAQNAAPGAAGSLYTVFKDVNGSGSILGSDVTLVRNRQGLSLPAGSFTTMESAQSEDRPLETTSVQAADLLSDNKA